VGLRRPSRSRLPITAMQK